MIYHFSDDDNVIGFFCIDQDPAKVAKKIGAITGTVFLQIASDKYDSVGSFEIDTIIIKSNLFNEDYIDLLEYGIAVYIIDF
jgi:hypothetical protein